jgi:hypothetical protein
MDDLFTTADILRTATHGTLSEVQLTDLASDLAIASDHTGGNEMSIALLAIASRLLDEVNALRNARP